MSSFLSEFSLAEQLSVSYLIGRAGGTAVEPLLVGLRQSAYQALIATGAFEVPAAIFLAEGVAQGQVDPKVAAQWASYQGFGQDQFNAMVQIANTGPPLASALTLLRRGVWTPGQYQGALNRAAIEPGWWPGLETLQDVWLTPEQIAVMIQRSVLPNPGILPNQPDSSGADVPPMPVIQIDPVAEAAGGGINEDRLKAMAEIIGLPASPDLAARMHFRGIINQASFYQAIKEGNTRGEWAPFLLEGFRQIPTAEQFVEAHLRGWIDQPTMYAGTAQWGMSQADTDLEYQIHRRPLTPHAIKQAIARGANFNPAPGEIQDPYTASVHQANLGPEWYEMAVALQGSYPSLFITNRLVTGGTISPGTGQQWLQKSGLADEVVTAMHDSWTGAGTTSADPHLTKAQTKAWTEAQASYIAQESTVADVTPILNTLGVPAGVQTQVTGLWDQIRTLRRRQLTPTQVKKAWTTGTINPATGVPWTEAEALQALLDRGYSDNDARTFLAE